MEPIQMATVVTHEIPCEIPHEIPLEIQTWQWKIRGLLMSTIAVYMIVVALDAMPEIYYLLHATYQWSK